MKAIATEEVGEWRDQKTGRYVESDMTRMCRCGHVLGRHSATTVASQRDCFADDCPCERFRAAAKK